MHDMWQTTITIEDNVLMESKWIDLNATTLPSLHNHTIVSFDEFDETIIFGGSNTERYSNDLWMVRNSTLEVDQIGRSGDWPCCRHGHSAVRFGKCMVVFGGKFGFGKEERLYGSDVWLFDLESKTWTELKCQTKPQPRCWHSACVYQERYMLVSGGFFTRNKKEFYFNDLWSFDMKTHQWTCLIADNPKHQTNPMKPRNRHGFIIHKDFLFVIFGNYFDGKKGFFWNDICFVDLSKFNALSEEKKGLFQFPENTWKVIEISALDHKSKQLLIDGRSHFITVGV